MDGLIPRQLTIPSELKQEIVSHQLPRLTLPIALKEEIISHEFPEKYTQEQSAFTRARAFDARFLLGVTAVAAAIIVYSVRPRIKA